MSLGDLNRNRSATARSGEEIMPAPVIVAHNDDTIRDLTTHALRAAGHDVVAFDNPMLALDAMEGRSQIRVLVTRVDFGPRQLNGAALARMVRSKQPGIGIVFIGREENRDYTTDLGEFLPLPLDPKALVAVVSRMLVS